MRRSATVVAVTCIALAFLEMAASALWAKPVSSAGTSSARTLSVPGTGTAGSPTTSSLALSWTAPSGLAPTGYVVLRSLVSGGPYAAVPASSTCTGTISTTSCTDTNLVASTTYYYTVQATISNWAGPSNPQFSGTTSNAFANKLVFTTVPAGNQTATATASIGGYVVQQQTAGGVAFPAASAVTVNLASNSSGTSYFSLTSGGASGTAVTSVTISTGQSSTPTFYYADTKAGTPTLTASNGSIPNSGSTSPTVVAAAQNRFAITSSAVSGAASSNATLGPITIQRQDSFGNAAAPAGALTVNLGSSSAGAKFAATSGGAAITTMQIASGSSSVNAFYGDTVAGTPTITASGTITSGTQLQTITAGGAVGIAFRNCIFSSGDPTLPTCSASTMSVGNGKTLSANVDWVDTFGNSATGSALTVNLSSSDTSQYTVTTSVTIIAGGSRSSTLTVTPVVNSANTTTITAQAAGVSSVTIKVAK